MLNVDNAGWMQIAKAYFDKTTQMTADDIIGAIDSVVDTEWERLSQQYDAGIVLDESKVRRAVALNIIRGHIHNVYAEQHEHYVY